MPAIVAKLSDQDIDALATFLAAKARARTNTAAGQ
jgi:cytochrome c553